jgi:L-ascorbate metabolism protein UlaG (beta-lactamase superfamily)
VLPELPPAPAAETIDLRFLGVGGFLIRYTAQGTTDTLLTGPFYSNPTLGEIASQRVNPDGRLIDALLPPEADEARAIFVGHGHYDHLMDVPWIATHRAKRAVVYGNDAVVDTLATVGVPAASLQSHVNHPCEWTGECPAGHAPWKPFHVPGMRLRVWAVLSEHSPQFTLPWPVSRIFPDAVHLWRGEPLEPPATPPERPGDWAEGTTLAYVFDFLRAGAARDDDWDSDAVAFRVYYQDSAARRPFGVPPALVRGPYTGTGRRTSVDLALLCVGGSKQIAGQPGELLRALAPRWAVGSHWEDFFNPRELQVPRPRREPREPAYETFTRVIRGADPQEFLAGMKASLRPDAEYVLACPDAVTRFVRDEQRGWRRAASSERWRRAE